MFTSLSLNLLGIIFLSTLSVFYFKKKKYKDLNNNIYRALLLLTLFLLVLEMICVHTMSMREQIPLLNEIFCRMYILGTLVWLSFLIGYISCTIENDKYKSVKDFFKNPGLIIFSVVTLIFFALSCFFEMTFDSGPLNQYYVIGGAGVGILYVIYGLVALILIRILFTKINKNNLILRLPMIIFFISFVIFGILQLAIDVDFNELTFLFTFCVISIYFTFESQDYRLVVELDEANKEAEKADVAKTKFLTKISHEIRTPMNVIMGYSEVLLNKNNLTEKEVKSDLKNIYNAGKSLLETINNILTYSRIESGKEKIEENEYSISDVIGELESFAYAKIDPSKVKFNILLDGNIPSNYVGDRLKVYCILLNLVNNAIKYTEKGEITLTIKCDVVTDNIAQMVFEVKDTGIGIAKEDLEYIYDKLNQVNYKDYDVSGIGLGLALSKKIVAMFDGNISCESEFGIGSTFTVCINQKTIGDTKIKDLQHLKNKIKEKKDGYFDCSNRKILIVDDNKLNRIIIERLLKPYKIHYESIDSSKECIHRIKSGEKYDLIFLDHMMPELDGIETIRILRKMNKELPPIIAVTANIVTSLKETYIKEGFSDYLTKPVDTKDLHTLLKKYFDNDDEKEVEEC